MKFDKKYIIRILFFIVGLFISALGVAITKKGELGVSPISSVANILSIRFDFFTLGNWLIVWNCVLILGQVLVLRKKFRLFELLQIPLSFLFGYFTDFGAWIIKNIPTDSYITKLACVVIGTAVLAFGISITVRANVIMNSGEAFVKAVSDTIHKDFGTVKICFDIFCVVLSIILSLALCQFKIMGTREGTVLAAVATGFCVKLFSKLLNKIIKTTE